MLRENVFICNAISHITADQTPYLYSFGQPDMSPDLKSISLKQCFFPQRDSGSRQTADESRARSSLYPPTETRHPWISQRILPGAGEKEADIVRNMFEEIEQRAMNNVCVCVCAMSSSIRVWPAHRESNLTLEAPGISIKCHFNKGLILCFAKTVFCSRCAFTDVVISQLQI